MDDEDKIQISYNTQQKKQSFQNKDSSPLDKMNQIKKSISPKTKIQINLSNHAAPIQNKSGSFSQRNNSTKIMSKSEHK